MADLLERINAWDHAFSQTINNWGAEWIDPFFILISGELTWIPFYILVLLAVYRFYGWKLALLSLFAGIITLSLTDQISVHAFKEVFQRLRPCHEFPYNQQLRIVDGCGGQFGFVSSHATNTAGFASLMIFILRKKLILALPILLFWCLLVGYSRIYLGVHFLGDVLAGTLLGLGIGSFVGFIFNLLTRKLRLR